MLPDLAKEKKIFLVLDASDGDWHELLSKESSLLGYLAVL